MKLRTKLAIVLFILSAGVVAAGAVFIGFQVERFHTGQIVHQIEGQATTFEFLLRSSADGSWPSYGDLQQLAHASDLRLTLIGADGTVIFESDVSESRLRSVENHLNRPEIQEALRSGVGTGQRHSTTVDADLLYLARKIPDPLPAHSRFAGVAVLRVAIPLTRVQEAVNELRSGILLAGGTVLVLVLVITIRLSRRITRPVTEMAKVVEEIRAGRLDVRIATGSRDEIGRLGETLNGMIDKLNEDIVQLKKLERVRSEFLGNVSHELRTPLFALHTAIETLLSGAVDDPAVNRDFLQKALHHTQRLDDLLSDLIEISRIESGEMKMSFRYFDLRDFLSGVVAETQAEANRKNIRLSYDSRETGEVLGDKERLKQVMANLLSNAIKYTDSGGRVTVSAESRNGTVRVSVGDTGCGIPAEHLPRIFERFYRVDKDRSREVGGTGLGLAIVRHIVEAHGSTVEVRSEVGRGSVFSFTLEK